ncbi:MAG: LysM peptidoglycan-binding domain-containing protein, partial [Bacteroidales bacterium]|nr:LysM peptidoglycan-binding domain-containing protein [Bacteroidales bacterium]
MNRKVVYGVLMLMFCCGIGYSQTEKSNKTVVEDNRLFYVHEVVKGQTLYGLSKMYGVSIDEITNRNPSAKQGLKIGDRLYIQASKISVEMYAVKRGETLYAIAKNRRITESELLALNPGMSESLSEGQEIVVPLIKIVVVEEDVATAISSEENLTRRQKKALKEEEERRRKDEQITQDTPTKTQEADSLFHIVEQGETLYGIARKYGLTVYEIKDANPELGETLAVGERIYIPLKDTDISQLQTDERDIMEEKENIVIKEGTQKQEYTVFVLLPLYLSEAEAIDPMKIKSLPDYKKVKSFDFIQFYEALLLAAEDVSAKYPQVKINLYVEDVNSAALAENLVSSGKLDQADLIIGPFHAKEFNVVCQYAQRKNVLLVNPFSEVFEYCGVPVYKGTSSFALRGEAFARYLLTKYSGINIIFAGYQSNNENKQIAEYKTGMRKVFDRSDKTVNIQDVNLKSGGISGIKSAMSNFNENFVFTFFEGELSVTNFTQNLNAAKLSRLTLVTPESWLDYDNIETEYFMNLNTHYIAQFFVDYSNPRVIRFIDAFRNAYETEPSLELYAFQGYDFT